MKLPRLILLFSALVFLAACRKEDTPREFMKFKRDGSWYDCDGVSYLSFPLNGGQGEELKITGNWLRDKLSLSLYSENGPVKSGKYVFSPGSINGAIITWTFTLLTTVVSYYKAGGELGSTDFYGPGEITITQAEGDYIQGNFSFKGVSQYNNELIITEGSFRVRKR